MESVRACEDLPAVRNHAPLCVVRVYVYGLFVFLLDACANAR